MLAEGAILEVSENVREFLLGSDHEEAMAVVWRSTVLDVETQGHLELASWFARQPEYRTD